MMNSAPERIWTYKFEDGDTTWHRADFPESGSTEYVRADLFPRWRPITDAQKEGRETYYVCAPYRIEPQNAYFEPDEGVWLIVNTQEYIEATHYWDFGTDTPLPPQIGLI